MQQMQIPNELPSIRDVEKNVLGRLRAFGYDEDGIFAVRLALEEALVNAMRHGNHMSPVLPVTVDYDVSDERVVIQIRDCGEGFDPSQVPDPTADENLQRPCGRGLMLMRTHMDEVTYSDKGSEVTMVKYKAVKQVARQSVGGEAMDIQTRRQDDCWVVALNGTADVNGVPRLREELHGLLETELPRLICDLSKTDFICSDVLGVLITAHLKAVSRGGFLRLAALQSSLREVLETTRLNHLFAIYPDVAGALKA